MSLILEALKKLEREKEAPQRGFLVVAPTSWPSRSRHLAVPLAVGGIVLVAAVGTAVLLRGRSREVVANTAPAVAPSVPAAAVVGAPPAPVQAAPLPAAPAPATPVTDTAVGARPSAGRVDPRALLPPVTTPERALVDFGGPAPARAVPQRVPGAPAAPATAAGSTVAPAPAGAPDAAPVLEITHGAPPPPIAAGPKGLDGIRLEAISSRDGHPVAMLSGRLMREGETFDGVLVVRIGADEVELEHNGRRRIVKF